MLKTRNITNKNTQEKSKNRYIKYAQQTNGRTTLNADLNLNLKFKFKHHTDYTTSNLTSRGTCIVIYSYNKTNEMH